MQLTDKVGGALLPSKTDKIDLASRTTAHTYFLASLQRQKLTFHVYPSPQLTHAAAAALQGLFVDTENANNTSQRIQPTDDSDPAHTSKTRIK